MVSKVTFTSPHATGNAGSVLLDDVPLPNVRSVSIASEVGQPNRVHLEMLARGGLDVTLQADVSVTLRAFPGFDVLHTVDADGTTRWRVVKTDAANWDEP